MISDQIIQTRRLLKEAKGKIHEGCQSWACKTCEHYILFLTVSTMQGICWNKGCFYEEGKASNE